MHSLPFEIIPIGRTLNLHIHSFKAFITDNICKTMNIERFAIINHLLYFDYKISYTSLIHKRVNVMNLLVN